MLGFSPLASASLGDDGAEFTPAVVGLTGNNVAAGNFDIGSSTVTQRHTLFFADVVTNRPAVDSFAILQSHSLSPEDTVTDTIFVGPSVVFQEHSIFPADIATRQPTIPSVTALRGDTFEATPITIGNPVVVSPDITQGHSLILVGVSASPVVDNSVFGQAHSFVTNSIVTNNPFVGRLSFNASRRRVVSIDSDSTNQATISEIFNGAEVDNNNYADLQNKYNRVA